MAMLAMTILVHFWLLYWVTASPTHASQGPTCGTIMHTAAYTYTCSHLGHARLVRWQLPLPHGAFYVLCDPITAHKPVHGHDHGHGGKAQKKNYGVNLCTRAAVVVLVGLCMSHWRVICMCGYYYYATPNRQYGSLLTSLLPDLAGDPELELES